MPNTYLLGSYRIATAPDPNSTRLTSLKSIRFRIIQEYRRWVRLKMKRRECDANRYMSALAFTPSRRDRHNSRN
jgi:hypothetical protein